MNETIKILISEHYVFIYYENNILLWFEIKKIIYVKLVVLLIKVFY